jgi:hypothetical protein
LGARRFRRKIKFSHTIEVVSCIIAPWLNEG